MSSGGSPSGSNGASSNAQYTLVGSVGLPIAGFSQSSTFTLQSGFIGALPPPPGPARQIVLTANPTSIVVSGAVTSTLTAEIRDDKNNRVETATNAITFATDFGSLQGSTTVSAVGGQASTVLQSDAVGTAHVTATSPGLISGTTIVQFTGAAAKLVCTAAAPVLVADGAASTTIMATVCDTEGRVVATPAVNVTFSTTAGDLVGTNPAATVNGVVTIHFRAPSSEATATITAAATGLTDGSAQVQCITPKLSLPTDVKAAPGTFLSVPLNLRGPSPIAGIQATVLFDSGLLTLGEAVKGNLLAADPDWTIQQNSPSPGKLIAIISAGTKLKTISTATDQPVALLRFRTIETAALGATSDLQLVSVTKLVNDHGDALPLNTVNGKVTVATDPSPLSITAGQVVTSMATVAFSEPVNESDAVAVGNYRLESPYGAFADLSSTVITYDASLHKATVHGLSLSATAEVRITVTGVRDADGNVIRDDSVRNVWQGKVEKQSDSTTVAAGWNLVSLPLEPFDPWPSSVLGDDLSAVLTYGWGASQYVFNPALHLGAGLWLFNGDGASKLVDVEGTPAAITGDHGISLAVGWNLIGMPFTGFDVSWKDCKVKVGSVTKPVADAPEWIGSAIYWWNKPEGRYDYAVLPEGQLTPWKGYWLLALTDATLLIPPVPSHPSAPVRPYTHTPRSAVCDIPLRVTYDRGSDQITARLSESATEGFDGFGVDLPKPPAGPCDLFLSFPHPDWSSATRGLATAFAVDARKLTSRVAWSFEVLSSLGAGTLQSGASSIPQSGIRNPESLVLTWPDLTQLPHDLRLTLVDLDTGVRRYMRTTSSYTFTAMPGVARRFQLVVERGAWNALRITNVQAFGLRSGEMTITYILSMAAQSQVTVRSASGRLLTRLMPDRQNAQGLVRAVWDRRTSAGRPLPRGVYTIEVAAVTPEGQAVRAVRTVRVR